MSNFANLVESFDDDDMVEEPTSGQLVSKTSTTVKLPIPMWGQFCFDLIMTHPHHAQVCSDYGIPEDHLLELLENKAFIDRLKDAKIQVKTLGPSAGFVLTARTQAERHLVTLGQIADQVSVHPGVRVKAIENIVRYAHLDPQTQKQSRETERDAASPGVLVQFNIGGGLLGSGMKTIEIASSPLPEMRESGQ